MQTMFGKHSEASESTTDCNPRANNYQGGGQRHQRLGRRIESERRIPARRRMATTDETGPEVAFASSPAVHTVTTIFPFCWLDSR